MSINETGKYSFVLQSDYWSVRLFGKICDGHESYNMANIITN